ncbi:2-oxoadipate dioxygenase/decarboxylase family protein [Sphingomonas sp.]|jgi:hypothetical protein|uniref:2-oxoadipate dioxygenase/decarboxylase family protein n=1 Tax=Sphingomonas sp. TaxID=28214 RepID=UPI002E1503EA|nr:DUF1338 family protein [Sphingomonas sp.]HEV7287929.1 DUF1338 family protein [Sphingomonas sp.]
MPLDHTAPGARLVARLLGARAAPVLATIDLDAPLSATGPNGTVPRAGLAAALNVLLFDDLLARVPTGAAFVAEQRARDERIRFDHGAIRTVRLVGGDTGALPAGQAAMARILQPLGYAVPGIYPLPRLRMTGHAWAHRDQPELLPQFFVSELHVDQFDAQFQDVAQRVFGTSSDPLSEASRAALLQLERDESIPFQMALDVLPNLLSAFGRQHETPSLRDYEALLSQSAEAAWIATEGNAFNHATSRVADIYETADRQRARGVPIKDAVEVSQNGRVRQTAFRADPVERPFAVDGSEITRRVPGSFYEIISRDIDPGTGALDLSFDTGNATGIFAMTRAA